MLLILHKYILVALPAKTHVHTNRLSIIFVSCIQETCTWLPSTVIYKCMLNLWLTAWPKWRSLKSIMTEPGKAYKSHNWIKSRTEQLWWVEEKNWSRWTAQRTVTLLAFIFNPFMAKYNAIDIICDKFTFFLQMAFRTCTLANENWRI